MLCSDAGRDFIRGWERLYLTAYDDGYGFATVGWGHLCLPSDQIRIGDTISRDRAIELFEHDIRIPERLIGHLGVELEQNQFDAVASLVWNIGGKNFAGSTIRKYLVAHTLRSVPDEFGKWIRSAGKVSAGLIKRREAEQEMWLAGIYDSTH